MSWPDESALGVNIGFSPATSGTGLFYAHGGNQWNIGALYAIGSVNPDLTDVKVGASYNRTLTDWGLFFATGMVLTYMIEEGTEPERPFEPDLPPTGAAWRSHGAKDPVFLLELGQRIEFGSRDQFGIHADVGAAADLDSKNKNPWGPIVGAGMSYRFRIN